MDSLEIDFLTVGNGERSGDAIALRYGNFTDPNQQYVIVIDGGTIDSGKKLIELIKSTYSTNYVDLVICTHPDGDHSSGLREVLKQLTIGELWIQQPWNYSHLISDMFKDGRMTPNSLSERLKDAYSFAYELVQIANKKNITINEPYAGRTFNNGTIELLGPSKDYYVSLIPEFNKSPEVKEDLIVKAYTSLMEGVKAVMETMDYETLDESGETTGENNTSVVTLLKFNSQNYLFTGDAGIPALKKVIEYSKTKKIDLSNLNFFQVPHHGSKRNISPSILNVIKTERAYISAAKEDTDHPSKRVINALIRRGASVYSTEGKNLRFHNNAPAREGYSAAIPLPFFDQVEE
jgi:beta-lactamase superfamily II metal-dependent hydrolase